MAHDGKKHGEHPVEKFMEAVVFNSRWLLAPLYAGLTLALLILVVKYAQAFVQFVPQILHASEEEVILELLSFVDMVLIANLILMILFVGYENFVSKIDLSGHVDCPPWMGTVDAAGLKLRLIASIVAISAIKLLKGFVNAGSLSDRELSWLVGIHVTFVVTGLLLAIMNRMEEKQESGH